MIRKSVALGVALIIPVMVGYWLLGLRPLPIQASTYDVCADNLVCPYFSIQDAINAATNDAVILLAPETFTENLVIPNTVAVSLVGAGVGSTIVDGSGSIAGESTIENQGVLTLTNMTITGGRSDFDGGGIYNNGVARVQQVHVTNNRAVDFGGGISNAGEMILENSQVTGNTVSQGDGGGIDNSGVMTMTHVLVQGNQAIVSGSFGGGISTITQLYADGITVTGNSAAYGGGVLVDSLLDSITIRNSQVATNTATTNGGGVLVFFGRTTIDRTQIFGNVTQDYGAGVVNSGNLQLSGSAIFNNQATGLASRGGGLFNDAAVTAVNTTISGNSASRGAGVYNGNLILTATAVFTNVTLFNNISAQSGVAIFNDDANVNAPPVMTVSLANTIVGGSLGFPNCAGSGNFVSQGHNLSDDTTCNLVGTGDLPGVNSLLGPLKNNGGGTLTHAPSPASRVIDAGSTANCPVVDQRLVARPSGAGCDIGAVELVLTQVYLPITIKP